MIYVDKKKKEPIYRQLYSSIVAEILAGAMPAGYRLPATRKLAQELSIGRNTVEKAYQQLEAEGYVRARTGSGFTVEQIPLDFSGKEPDEGAQSALQKKEEKPKYDFAYGPMAGENFPYKQWRRCVNDVLTEMELQPALYYPDRYGEPALQKAVCGYLKRSRNVLCRPEDILITPGQQYAMEILANLISPEERTFAMEEPGYDGIRKVFEMNEFQIIPIKIQDGSITRESLEHVDAKLLYLTPSHQFPTGAVMPVGERRKILQWAEETETYLIEDDYDSELRYYTNPIPAMQSKDAGARTSNTGTISKSLAPVMRVSYMILPEALQEKYQQRFGRYHAMVSSLHQRALAEFIGRGYYEQHINRLRTLYRKKHAALLEAVRNTFGDRVKISGGGAGIHLLMDVKSLLSQEELIARAKTVGIRFYTTKVLYADAKNCPEHQLLLGFPIVPTGSFAEIMEKLAEVWEMQGYKC